MKAKDIMPLLMWAAIAYVAYMFLRNRGVLGDLFGGPQAPPLTAYPQPAPAPTATLPPAGTQVPGPGPSAEAPPPQEEPADRLPPITEPISQEGPLSQEQKRSMAAMSANVASAYDPSDRLNVFQWNFYRLKMGAPIPTVDITPNPATDLMTAREYHANWAAVGMAGLGAALADWY